MGCDHVVYTTEGELKCLHCGETYRLSFPMPVDYFVSETTYFIQQHQECKEAQ